MIRDGQPSELVARFGLSDEQAAAVARRGRLVVVSAGAGTGKTTTMASRYVDTALRLAADALAARPERPPRPRRILEGLAAVTFTELAAGELRARIARTFDAVRPRLADSPALAAFAEEAARLEGDLPIGTIHGLCARLLRRMAFTGAVPPDFAVLAEVDAGLLLADAMADATDALAEAEPALIGRLLSGRDESARLHRTVRSLVRSVPPDELAERAGWARPAFRAAMERAGLSLLHRVAAAPAIRGPVEEAAARAAALAACDPRRFPAALGPALRWVRGQGSLALAAEGLSTFGATARRLDRLDPALQPALERFSDAVATLGRVVLRVRDALADGAIAAQHTWTADLLRFAAEVGARFRAAKLARGALDFDDLERLAERALAEARGTGGFEPPYGEILVDEFQDTSARQVAILRGLAGDDLARAFAVGDAKQSIYRFRDADVAVFNAAAARAPGGAVELTLNRRSTAGVMALVNGLFGALMPAETPPDAPWEATMQRLVAVRGALESPPLPPLVVVPWSTAGDHATADVLRRRDAAATAWAIARVRGRAGEGASVGVLLRAVRGERRVYADAIDAAGLPVAVEAGGTFLRDGAAATGLALLRALALPGHEAAWLATLRGPLVGLDDVAAARLAVRDDGAWPDRVQRLLEAEPLLLGALRGPLEALTEAARDPGPLAERARRVVLAAGRPSRQLDKLLALAEELAERGLGPLEALAWFEALAADDREQRVADPGHGAVRALTVHASKGLEFPVVVVPQLHEPFVRAGAQPGVAVDVDGALALAPPVPDAPASALRLLAGWLERQRGQAEQVRLLYVALTRARDHVVLPFPVGTGDGPRDSAAGALGPLLAGLDLAREGPQRLPLPDGDALDVEVWPAPDEAVSAEPPPPSPLPPARPVRVAPPALGPATWSVTTLASLAFCPAYHAQAPVAPWPRGLRPAPWLDPPPPPPARAASSAERGTAFHAWLEAIATADDLAQVPPPAPLAAEADDLRPRLAALLRHPDLVAAFDPAARALAELPVEAERDGLVLTGTIDRVALRDDGRGGLSALVVDYKTGATGFPGPGGRNPAYVAAYRFQLAAYAWMLRALLGERLRGPVEGRLAFLDLGRVVRLDLDAAEAEAEVDRVLAEVRAPGTLPANHAACAGCRMKPFCPAARSPSPEMPPP